MRHGNFQDFVFRFENEFLRTVFGLGAWAVRQGLQTTTQTDLAERMHCTLVWDSASGNRHALSTPVDVFPDATAESRHYTSKSSKTNSSTSSTSKDPEGRGESLFAQMAGPGGGFVASPHATEIQEHHGDPRTIGNLHWYLSHEQQRFSHPAVASFRDKLRRASRTDGDGAAGSSRLESALPSSPRAAPASAGSSVSNMSSSFNEPEKVFEQIPEFSPRERPNSGARLVGSLRYDLVFGVHVTDSVPAYPKESVKSGMKHFLKFLKAHEADTHEVIEVGGGINGTQPDVPHTRDSVASGSKGGPTTESLASSAKPPVAPEGDPTTSSHARRQNSKSLAIDTTNTAAPRKTSQESLLLTAKSPMTAKVGKRLKKSHKQKQNFSNKSYLIITCLHFNRKTRNQEDDVSSGPYSKDNAFSPLENYSTAHRHETPVFRQIVLSFYNDDVVSLPPIKDSNGIIGPMRKVKTIDILYEHLMDSCIPFDPIGTSNIDDLIGEYIMSKNLAALTIDDAEKQKGKLASTISEEEKKTITHIRERNKIIYIAVNPFGGTQKAPSIYQEIVSPMLQIAGIPHEMIYTERRNHGEDLVRSLDLTKVRSIITISGDGLFHEIINGILSRDDWQKARACIPIGTVGGGTANAMSKNLDALTQVESCFGVLKGKTTPLDVFSCVQHGKISYSHLSITWTLIADLDIESEKYRWMGVFRMVFGALVRLMNMRIYKGTLYMLPTTPEDPTVQKFKEDNAVEYGENGEVKLPHQYYGSDQAKYEPLVYNGPKLRYTEDPTSYRKWPIVVDNEFSLFIATNLPYLSSDFFTSPYSRFGDGKMDVIYASSINRMDLLNSLSDQESGGFVFAPGLILQQVKAFVLEPGPRTGEPNATQEEIDREHIISVSGEAYPCDTIRVEVHSKCLNLLCPFWLKEDEWLNEFERKNKSSLSSDIHKVTKVKTEKWANSSENQSTPQI